MVNKDLDINNHVVSLDHILISIHFVGLDGQFNSETKDFSH